MNKDINIFNLSSMFASEDSYRNFIDMVNEMDLELLDITLS